MTEIGLTMINESMQRQDNYSKFITEIHWIWILWIQFFYFLELNYITKNNNNSVFNTLIMKLHISIALPVNITSFNHLSRSFYFVQFCAITTTCVISCLAVIEERKVKFNGIWCVSSRNDQTQVHDHNNVTYYEWILPCFD